MTKKDKSVANKAKLILLIGIPLLLILSLVLVFNRTKQQEEERYPVEEEEIIEEEAELEEYSVDLDESAEIAQIKKTLTYAPLNPTSVTATCQSTGEALVSGQATSCPDPVFTWSGERTREEGTKIIGYWVYFNQKNNTQPLYYGKKGDNQDLMSVVRPIVEGNYQEANIFTSTNLERGKTYYLAVSAKSDSQDSEHYLQYGITNPNVDNLSAQAAEILFTFVYQ